MKLEVKHSDFSVELIRSEQKLFTESKSIIRKVNHHEGVVIKFYPVSDTFCDLENGGKISCGMISSYFCEVKVYDLKNKKFYVSKILHDSLRVDEISGVYSFHKDLGYLHYFDCPVEIEYRGSCMVVKKLR